MMKNNEMMKKMENGEKGDKNAMSRDHRVGIYEFRLTILGIYLLTLYLLSTTFVIFDIT